MPTQADIEEHRMRGYAKSQPTYEKIQRKWERWEKKHSEDKSVEWIELDDKLKLFIVHLEKKENAPSTILLAIASLNALRTRLGRPSFYKNASFPLVNLAVKRLKRALQVRKVRNEEEKPEPLTNTEINTAFQNLANTPGGIQCKLYLILVHYLNHHSNKVIEKKVSDITIDSEGRWVEIWRGTNKKNATTKLKPDKHSRIQLKATPSTLYCCPVWIVRHHFQHLPATTPTTRLFHNYTKGGELSAQPMGKGNIKKCLFGPILVAIPQLTQPRDKYQSNSIHRATVIKAITREKEGVIECTKAVTHHSDVCSLNAYLTAKAHDLSAVENAVLNRQCTYSPRGGGSLTNLGIYRC